MDGLPLFHSWLTTAKGIMYQGFENWREVLEVKSVAPEMPTGEPLGYFSVVPVKGMGRVSIILWVVYWTYLHKDELDSESKTDFIRQVKGHNFVARNIVANLQSCQVSKKGRLRKTQRCQFLT